MVRARLGDSRPSSKRTRRFDGLSQTSGPCDEDDGVGLRARLNEEGLPLGVGPLDPPSKYGSSESSSRGRRMEINSMGVCMCGLRAVVFAFVVNAGRRLFLLDRLGAGYQTFEKLKRWSLRQLLTYAQCREVKKEKKPNKHAVRTRRRCNTN